jgi:hypothetical protein
MKDYFGKHSTGLLHGIGVWSLESEWIFLRQLAKLNENIPVQFAFSYLVVRDVE